MKAFRASTQYCLFLQLKSPGRIQVSVNSLCSYCLYLHNPSKVNSADTLTSMSRLMRHISRRNMGIRLADTSVPVWKKTGKWASNSPLSQYHTHTQGTRFLHCNCFFTANIFSFIQQVFIQQLCARHCTVCAHLAEADQEKMLHMFSFLIFSTFLL